ncbi:3-oxoacyl-ACP reductase FabG [Kitasatospora aburaviensis]
MRILGRDDVRAALAGLDSTVLDSVRTAYVLHSQGQSDLPFSTFLRPLGRPDSRIIALPAYLGGPAPVMGLKWISSFPENVNRGMQRASSLCILNDLESGYPVALMEGSQISAVRTAASAALAGGLLSAGRPVRTVGLIGCGTINHRVMSCLAQVHPDIETVLLQDAFPERAKVFAAELAAEYPGIAFRAVDVATALGAETVSIATTDSSYWLDLADYPDRPHGQVILHLSLRDLSPPRCSPPTTWWTTRSTPSASRPPCTAPNSRSVTGSSCTPRSARCWTGGPVRPPSPARSSSPLRPGRAGPRRRRGGAERRRRGRPRHRGRGLRPGQPQGHLDAHRERGMSAPGRLFAEGTRALVTGASRGIGAAIAIALAEHGCDVALNYRNSAGKAEEVAERIRALGRRALPVRADVSDEAQVAAMYKEIRGAWGNVEVAVLNSGVTADGHMAAMSSAKWQEVIGTNLTGAFLTAREATKQMYASGGAIVMIASTSGIAGRVGQANYAASKGGVISMAKTLAYETAGRGIRVNVVAPGFIDTDMVKKVPPAQLKEAARAIPLGRMGTAEEVAQAAVFLASPAASYITAKVLTVDGGMLYS